MWTAKLYSVTRGVRIEARGISWWLFEPTRALSTRLMLANDDQMTLFVAGPVLAVLLKWPSSGVFVTRKCADYPRFGCSRLLGMALDGFGHERCAGVAALVFNS